MFSHFLDQKEHKNNWYKFGDATWCYEPNPNVHKWISFKNSVALKAHFVNFVIHEFVLIMETVRISNC